MAALQLAINAAKATQSPYCHAFVPNYLGYRTSIDSSANRINNSVT